MKKILTILTVVILFFAAVLIIAEKPSEQSKIPSPSPSSDTGPLVIINGHRLSIEIADDSNERALGLSGRPEMPENWGLLFIFEYPGKHYFWMKDMNFPIDIIWMDTSGKIVHIENSLSPSTYPKSYGPQSDALYVLETKSGWAIENGIKIGDNAQIIFSY